MGQSIRSLLLSLAAASFIANGAQAVVGAGTATASNGANPSAIDYTREGDLVTAVTFRLASTPASISVRLSAGDNWHECSSSGENVSCSIEPRPVTTVNRFELRLT